MLNIPCLWRNFWDCIPTLCASVTLLFFMVVTFVTCLRVRGFQRCFKYITNCTSSRSSKRGQHHEGESVERRLHDMITRASNTSGPARSTGTIYQVKKPGIVRNCRRWSRQGEYPLDFASEIREQSPRRRRPLESRALRSDKRLHVRDQFPYQARTVRIKHYYDAQHRDMWHPEKAVEAKYIERVGRRLRAENYK